jgi:hypothetical protein
MTTLISVKQLVQEIVTSENEQFTNKPLNICFVLDKSGSTGDRFSNSMNVLEKEQECLSCYALNNPDNNYILYSFDSDSTYHGRLEVLKEFNFIQLPELRPGSATNTHLPLQDICDKVSSYKPDRVVVYTDGETNASSQTLTKISNVFKKNNIKLDIVAVSPRDLNMETISSREESRIPGMDLINMLGNSIDTLTIYNKYHNDVPYNGIMNSSVDKNCIKFMGIKINEYVVNFINKFLVKLNENKGHIDWGTSHIELKKMLSEMGKLLSLLFVIFPENHYFVKSISSQVEALLDGVFTADKISKIINYGFNCTKQDTPVLFTNFDEHVKDASSKRKEFSDAITDLKNSGTTLNCSKLISIPYGNNTVCVLDNGSVQVNRDFDDYPKSMDKFGNIYLGIDGNEQAIRIAMRQLCGKAGFPNARNSPSCVFYVLNLMSMMYLTGIDLGCEHMRALQKIAKAQTSLEVLVSRNKYDGKGCWAYWKSGNLIPMHFSSPNTHTTLYTDQLINPLQLSEHLWWGLMMSMLGLFEEQKKYFESQLNVIGVKTQEEFLG